MLDLFTVNDLFVVLSIRPSYSRVRSCMRACSSADVIDLNHLVVCVDGAMNPSCLDFNWVRTRVDQVTWCAGPERRPAEQRLFLTRR